MDAVTAGLVGTFGGATFGWLLARLDAGRNRKWAERDAATNWRHQRTASVEDWRRDAVHRSVTELAAAHKAWQHTVLHYVQSVAHGNTLTPDEQQDVEDSYERVEHGTVLFMATAPDDLATLALQLEDHVTALYLDLRNSKPVGVGTPTETSWRMCGRLVGALLVRVRAFLTGDALPEPGESPVQ